MENETGEINDIFENTKTCKKDKKINEDTMDWNNWWRAVALKIDNKTLYRDKDIKYSKR